jgi:hypothetical protein
MGKHTVRCHPPLRNGHAVVVIPSTRPARPLAVRRRTPVPRTARTRSRPHGGRTGCFPSLCKPRSAPTNDRSIPPWRNRQTRARCAGAARLRSGLVEGHRAPSRRAARLAAASSPCSIKRRPASDRDSIPFSAIHSASRSAFAADNATDTTVRIGSSLRGRPGPRFFVITLPLTVVIRYCYNKIAGEARGFSSCPALTQTIRIHLMTQAASNVTTLPIEKACVRPPFPVWRRALQALHRARRAPLRLPEMLC